MAGVPKGLKLYGLVRKPYRKLQVALKQPLQQGAAVPVQCAYRKMFRSVCFLSGVNSKRQRLEDLDKLHWRAGELILPPFYESSLLAQIAVFISEKLLIVQNKHNFHLFLNFGLF